MDIDRGTQQQIATDSGGEEIDMDREILTNTYNGLVIGTIVGDNMIETSIGTYEVTDADIAWLRRQQGRKSFCVEDIKAVGQLIQQDEYAELECICDTCDGCLWWVNGECRIEIED